MPSSQSTAVSKEETNKTLYFILTRLFNINKFKTYIK